ncbi:helix-turn-helix domain-containing protein [Solirubrobacter pauli]|nr:helix-turn-helix domain-containing protein [Solirubrobacter pauli]
MSYRFAAHETPPTVKRRRPFHSATCFEINETGASVKRVTGDIRPESELDLLRSVERRVAERMPRSWSVSMDREVSSGPGRLDGVLIVRAPDHQTAIIPVEAKLAVSPRDLPLMLEQVRRLVAEDPAMTAPPLIVARYLNPRVRASLVEQGLSYADATGNLRLTSERPAIYVEAAGADADPWRGPEKATRSLSGRPAAKIVRALVDFRPPVGVRELAARSGASPATVSRVVDYLDRETLVRRDERGTVTDVDIVALLRQWSGDYFGGRVRPSVTGFEPRGPLRVLERLPGIAARSAVTGSLSARRVVELAPPAMALVYADEPERVAGGLRLRDNGPANVVIARPPDPVVYERADLVDGVTFCAWSQTAVDLLTGPGRSPAEGEGLLYWMVENERAWRR